MILQHNVARAVFLNMVFRNSDVYSWAAHFNIVLHQHSVMKNSYTWWCKIIAFIVEAWSGVNNVVSLPLARFFAGIYKRCMLFVHTAGLAVSVSAVVVIVEHLHFVTSLQENSAVAAPLAFANYFRRSTPLNVKLNIFENTFCFNRTGSLFNGNCAISKNPFRFAAILACPLTTKVGTIK